MSRSIIGNVRVHLGIDSAQFQAGLNNATKGMDRFAKQAAKMGAVIGTAIAGAITVAAVSVNRVINEADKLGDVADRLGVTTESLQELRYAAERGGMEMGNFDVAYRRFIRRSAEAAQGTGAAKKAFEEMGISLRDSSGRLKEGDALLGEVADALRNVQDPADRLRLAFSLFDTDGAAMVNVLAQGSDGLMRMREEARNLGIVLSDDAVRGAQAFKDNLDSLGYAKDGLITKLTAHLLPALEDLSEQFVSFVNDEEAVRTAAQGMTAAFEWIAVASMRLVAGIRGVRAEIAAMVDAGQKLMSGDFSGARDAWNAGQDEAARIIRETEERIANGLLTTVSQGGIQRRIDAAFGEAGSKAAETFVKSVETASSKGGGGARVRSAFDEMAAEAARIFDQTRTPLERYQAQIARLNELLQAGAINQDTYNRAVLQAQDAFDQAEQAGKKAEGAFQNIGRTMAWSFSSAFQGIVDGSKKVSEAIGDLLRQFGNLLINSAFQTLFGVGSGGSGGGLFSGLLSAIGFRANGGPVSAGRPYIVGERGPELMVPNTSGTVIRNADLKAGGGGDTYAPQYIIDARGSDAGVEQRVRAALQEYDKGSYARWVSGFQQAKKRNIS